jgi:putative addiction module component (TIGR02574 family)
MNIDQLASEALRLNPKDRATLAETIWESLEDPYIDAAYMSDEDAVRLAHQRDDEMDNGHTKPLSHNELMDRLRGNEG